MKPKSLEIEHLERTLRRSIDYAVNRFFKHRDVSDEQLDLVVEFADQLVEKYILPQFCEEWEFEDDATK